VSITPWTDFAHTGPGTLAGRFLRTFWQPVYRVGRGRIADRERERLGRGDAGIILLRKIWARELRALAEGRPLKQWTHPEYLASTAGV
jgi:hypothetical protein